jgi:hypothetical protein
MAGETHDVNLGGINFFEEAMRKHSAVESLTRISEQYYRLERTNGDTLLVYLSGIYVLGLFDYHDLVHQYPGLSSIVLAGPWQNFSPDAKEQAVSDGVGLFKVKGLMGSLRRDDHWNYDGPATAD